MRKSQMWVTVITTFLVVVSLWYLFPTFRLWSMSEAEREKLKSEDPGKLVTLEKKAIKLGLDLKGGMHVVLEVDKSKLKEDEKRDAVDRALEIIRNRVDQFGVSEPLIHKGGQDRIIVELPGLQDVQRAQDLIGKTALLEFKLLETPENSKTIVTSVDQALAGTKISPDTAAKKDTTQKITDIFGQTQKDTLPEQLPEGKPFTSLLQPFSTSSFAVIEEDVPLVKKMLADSLVQKNLPPDVEFAWSTKPIVVGKETLWGLYVVKKPVQLTGKYLTDARPSRDEFGKPTVNFTLTREGGRIFAALTGANIGKPLAIILDGKIESAPEIRARIYDRGQITLGGGGSDFEARDLSVILRAGALPAPVKIIQNRVIGPSLGQDSIHKGLISSIIGGIAVILFMAIYYRLSGVIADFALILNLLYLMAIMSALHATLTLPGIAGVILTMGMSVDSNVLIFERIREELRTGKTIRASIDAGYKRALLTIIDSHVTTLITAFALFLFGTGPVKGFAVTLSWGIIISLFTALIVTKLIFDVRKQYQTLSI